MAALTDLKKVGVNKLKNAVTGEEVELKSLWKERACVLLFLHRLGCLVCHWIAKETSKLKDILEKDNTHLIGIAPETVGLEEFQSGHYFTGELYIDETKQCYKDLGFKSVMMSPVTDEDREKLQ